MKQCLSRAIEHITGAYLGFTSEATPISDDGLMPQPTPYPCQKSMHVSRPLLCSPIPWQVQQPHCRDKRTPDPKMLLSRVRSTTDGAYTGSTSEAICISSSAQANRILAPPHLEGHTLALLAPGQLPSGSTVLGQEWGSTHLGGTRSAHM